MSWLMKNAPKLWWSEWGSQDVWRRSHERGFPGWSQKPSSRVQIQIPRWLAGSNLVFRRVRQLWDSLKRKGKVQRKETYKRTSRQQKPMVGYYEGKNTYVQRVVKSCGRSLRRFLQTRPKTIISKYLMLIEQYFFADLINA